MKIRNGFVSNSSSSSFLIYGTQVEGVYDYEKMEEMCDKLKDNELRYFGSSDMGFYIGRSWGSVRDNETGKAFKESVEKGVEAVLGKTECGTHEAAWHD